MISQTPLSSKGNRAWSVTTPPTYEPVTIEEVKAFGRIVGAEEDSLLSSFITTIISNIEKYLGRALITQTITMYMDYWPGNIIQLPRPPLVSITSVATLDEDSIATIYDADNYYAFTNAVPGELVLKQGVTEPVNYERDRGGYRIIFVAGYGAEPQRVPSPIRNAIIDWAYEAFDTRMISDEPPPRLIKRLMPFKVSRYAFRK